LRYRRTLGYDGHKRPAVRSVTLTLSAEVDAGTPVF
jgi:hypothetical protein